MPDITDGFKKYRRYLLWDVLLGVLCILLRVLGEYYDALQTYRIGLKFPGMGFGHIYLFFFLLYAASFIFLYPLH